MKKAQIRFSTDILSRLGEELNPKPDQGIIELVKNAYDANAKKCTIKFDSVRQIGGSLEITDDGDGMDTNDIANNWLVLGRSVKSKSIKTRLGRIPAGSKGLGRLAALRMGNKTTLETRPINKKTKEYRVVIDWSDFDEQDIVENVPLEITDKTRDKNKKDGSIIKIEDLRVSISRQDVKSLSRALILLADPFSDDPQGFEPTLDAPEFRDLERLVKNRYFEEADYHLVATLDGRGKSSVKVTDWKGQTLFEAEHDEVASSRNGSKYRAPKCKFDLWVYLLNPTAFSTKNTTIKQVREWLKEFGGVHLYENNLRVQPYGNKGNDWLEINLRRAQSPEERPSTNTVIGRVSVTDTKDILVQKTDRSGFIEGESFDEMREFARDALEWMARCRMNVAEKRRAKKRKETKEKSSKTKKNLEDVIKTSPVKSRNELQKAFTEYERSKQKEVTELRKEVQLYRTLSTAGITAATFAHETTGNPIKIINNSLTTVESRSKKHLADKYKTLLLKPIDRIKQAIDSLAVLSTATLRLLDQNKRRVGRVDIHQVINNVVDTFEPFLKGRGVTLEEKFVNGGPYLRGSSAAVESIITNLLNNSLNAFESVGSSDRKIRISTEVEDDWITLEVDDSGPGITGISKKHVWIPGHTTQENGTGLGLTIVYDAVKDLDGEVDAVEHGDLGGAKIIIKLPILGL